MIAKSNRAMEGNGGRSQGTRKWKEKSFCFVVVKFELIFGHQCFHVICAWIEFFGEVGHFIEERISGAVYHPRKADGLQSG